MNDSNRKLPPDPDYFNAKRAAHALKALSDSAAGWCDLADALPDLLCDMMHLADRNPDVVPGGFDKQLERARRNHRNETTAI